MFANKKIIWVAVIVLVALVGYLVYSMFYRASSSTAVTPTTSEADVTVVTAGAADTGTASTGGAADSFVQVLSSISDVKLSGGIFNDPVFANYLQDFSRPLPDRDVGRVNPFAPIKASEQVTKRVATSTGTSTNQ
jgi:hypothetical protein